MSIIFVNSGVLTTVQDRGRMGHQRYGFHVSGAMDKRAYEIGNVLVDNFDNEAVLEFAVMGPTIKFSEDSVIAITGADFAPTLNDVPVQMYHAIQIHKGDVLKLGFSKDGVWGYLSIAGGIDVPVVMGSRSTDVKSELGGYQGRKIQNGDELPIGGNIPTLLHLEKRVYEKPVYARPVSKIRVVLGPQDDYFTMGGLSTFLGSEYEVTNQCDRMGYRLSGETIAHNENGSDIISDGIAYGSIQVPSQGQPIVLLSDRQTTGGYTKIATVIGRDIPKFVQRKPGEKVVFEAVSVEEAQRLYIEEFNEFQALRDKIKGINTGFAGLKLFIKKTFKIGGF